MKKPTAKEHAKYLGHYISLVEEGNITELMSLDMERTIQQLESIDEETSQYRYAEDKWSIRQVILHLIDTERVFAYRLLRMLREEEPKMKGYDQDDWAEVNQGLDRSWIDIIEELFHVRQSTIALVDSLTEDDGYRMGEMSGAKISVRAIIYAIIGHGAHHRQILQERYLNHL